jgi:hypothetical protein
MPRIALKVWIATYMVATCALELLAPKLPLAKDFLGSGSDVRTFMPNVAG